MNAAGEIASGDSRGRFDQGRNGGGDTSDIQEYEGCSQHKTEREYDQRGAKIGLNRSDHFGPGFVNDQTPSCRLDTGKPYYERSRPLIILQKSTTGLTMLETTNSILIVIVLTDGIEICVKDDAPIPVRYVG